MTENSISSKNHMSYRGLWSKCRGHLEALLKASVESLSKIVIKVYPLPFKLYIIKCNK